MFQLPAEVQAKVRTYVAQKGPSSDSNLRDVKSITVPIATFPPTAMVYNVTRASASKNEEPISNEPKPPVDIVSASIMAKILEDREKERIFAKHCETCSCHRSILKVDSEVQTMNTSETSCNDCQNKQQMSRADDVENRDNVTERRDNFKYDQTTKQYKHIRDSYSRSIFREVNDCLKINNKLRTKNSDCSSKHTIYQCVNEVAENKNNQKSDIFKTVSRTVGSRSYSSLRKSTMHQNSINSQNITVETKLIAPENLKDKQDEKFDFLKEPSKLNHWSDVEKASLKGRAAQVDIINDRLWKSSWTKSESQPFRDPNVNRRILSSKDTQLDVINDRVWKNYKSKTKEAKPTQLTLIEVASVDELTNTSEIMPAESTASPSFSSDSVIFSTSDPSSISSDVIQSTCGGLSKQEKRDCNTTLKSSKQAQISGLENCLMRVSGRSNILLDNVHNYQALPYANTVATPNTTMIHTTSSCKSTKSASTSSEENSSMISPDNVQLQRVAEWVKSSVQLDESCVQFQSKPLLEIKITEAKHFEGGSKNHNPKIQSKSFVDELKYSKNEENNAEKKEKDLITFDPSSDEEKDLNVIELDSLKVDPNLDINYEVKITKEMEETYLKLTASLDPVALCLSSLTGKDLTIQKYRQDHRRFQKVSAQSGSAT